MNIGKLLILYLKYTQTTWRPYSMCIQGSLLMFNDFNIMGVLGVYA
jgi:hypothetical protein